jgi:Ca2+-binding EF-hand superfamily protein
MNLGIALEDITEMFNYIDTDMSSTVSKTEFVEAVEYVNRKMGG